MFTSICWFIVTLAWNFILRLDGSWWFHIMLGWLIPVHDSWLALFSRFCEIQTFKLPARSQIIAIHSQCIDAHGFQQVQVSSAPAVPHSTSDILNIAQGPFGSIWWKQGKSRVWKCSMGKMLRNQPTKLPLSLALQLLRDFLSVGWSVQWLSHQAPQLSWSRRRSKGLQFSSKAIWHGWDCFWHSSTLFNSTKGAYRVATSAWYKNKVKSLEVQTLSLHVLRGVTTSHDTFLNLPEERSIRDTFHWVLVLGTVGGHGVLLISARPSEEKWGCCTQVWAA